MTIPSPANLDRVSDVQQSSVLSCPGSYEHISLQPSRHDTDMLGPTNASGEVKWKGKEQGPY